MTKISMHSTGFSVCLRCERRYCHTINPDYALVVYSPQIFPPVHCEERHGPVDQRNAAHHMQQPHRRVCSGMLSKEGCQGV